MIHLDTNVVIALLTGRSPHVISAFQNEVQRGHDFVVSVVVLHELRYGAAKSQKKLENNARTDFFLSENSIEVLPLSSEDAEHAGEIRAHLEKQGTPIGPYDVLIAAQTRRLGATLVTANTREFSRIPGLKLVDWSS
jgi:tRNA(fMet)-specific endonuclease VapC